MGIIGTILLLIVIIGIVGAVLESGLLALICLLSAGGVGYAIGSWLGGGGWAIFGAILGSLIGLAAAKEM